MDILLSATTTTLPKTLDIAIDDYGCSIDLFDDNELIQQGAIAVYLTRGSTPQVPLDGVDWQSYIGGIKSMGELDADIKGNIEKLGNTTLYPSYDIVNNKLTVNILKGGAFNV
jgi:hypothetical protein